MLLNSRLAYKSAKSLVEIMKKLDLVANERYTNSDITDASGDPTKFTLVKLVKLPKFPGKGKDVVDEGPPTESEFTSMDTVRELASIGLETKMQTNKQYDFGDGVDDYWKDLQSLSFEKIRIHYPTVKRTGMHPPPALVAEMEGRPELAELFFKRNWTTVRVSNARGHTCRPRPIQSHLIMLTPPEPSCCRSRSSLRSSSATWRRPCRMPGSSHRTT